MNAVKAMKAMESTPQPTETSRLGMPISRQVTLALGVMIVLVVFASGISLWLSTSVQHSIQSMRLATDHAIQLSNLQLRWLSIAGILDTYSVTRPSPEARQELERQLEELNRELLALTAQPIGLTAEKKVENQQLAANLQRAGLDMTQLTEELYTLIEQGRWGTALQKRQSTMAAFQVELTDNLNQLNANIQSDVAAQVAEIARLQSTARQFAIVAIGLSLIFAVLVIYFTRRTILAPLGEFITGVRQVSLAQSAADLQPVEPLARQDEIGELSRALARMVNWLRDSYSRLEEQVQERTSRLQRRSIQLEVAAQVARDIAAAHDLETLLNRAVNIIHDRFEFYHAGIFLIDQLHEYAVLRAATGEAGREMLNRNHRLQVGQTGLVGYAAQSGEARVASDVELDAVHYRNPLLPETRSEAALPLKIAGRVTGVLDVQSRQPGAFDPESLTVLQIMADQLAIAIQNARLLQESREALDELETTYRRFNRQSWERVLFRSQVVGYEFDGMNASPILKPSLTKSDPAQSAQKPPEAAPLQIPLQVRGDTIGALDIWTEGRDLTEAETYLLAAISNRLSQILESARLYEEAQARATREQSINLITSQMRASVNLENILQKTVRELGRTLGASRAFIQIGGELHHDDADKPLETPPFSSDPPAAPAHTSQSGMNPPAGGSKPGPNGRSSTEVLSEPPEDER
ncbi:MAG: hypothetical protein B6D39_04205 [Anaerolineae bacterium UTCFX2]|jgi:GAF domain-containing protein/HAMP domain-containing protein|nr:MAG: hypothetical protein B6D39_04205 [Anaerolineae bacterium UTCFX2]